MDSLNGSMNDSLRPQCLVYYSSSYTVIRECECAGQALSSQPKVVSMTSPQQTETSSAPKPVRGRPFAPGVSGNPAGRPRKLEALADAIRRKADPDELADIALTIARTSKSEAIRIQALDWLQRCGYARPAERHELAVERTEAQYNIEKLPLAERVKLLEQVRALRVSDGSANRGSELQAGDDASESYSGTPSCAGGEQ